MTASPTAPAVGRYRPEPDPFLRYALWAIAVVTVLRLVWLAGAPIDLYPDEAQYWIWAQHPAFGYFSKPPVVAWIIALTTLGGQTDLAVKLGAPLTYVGTSLLVFAIAARLYDRRVAMWSAIAFVTLPAVSLSSVIMSTDVPLLFFWALATYGLVRARASDDPRWWLLVGAAGGLGLLSKYAMGFWLASALGFLVAFPDERRHLRSFVLAFVLAVAIYLPNFAWNAVHGFVSYRHTEANANVHGFTPRPGPLLEFAGSQFVVFGPIFLATLLVVAARGRRALADRTTSLLLIFALPTLAVMICVAALSRAQPNWSAPTYISATILVVAWLIRVDKAGLVRWSIVLHIAIAILAFGASDIARYAGHPLPGKYDPLHRVHGWRTLGRTVSEIRLQHLDLPLLGDERELMSALIYYMQPHPFDMLTWNPSGRVRNGFEMTQSLPATPGGDYLWITGRTERTEIFDRFDQHTEVAHVFVPLGPGLARQVWIYELRGFKGYAGTPVSAASAMTPPAAAP